MTRTISSTYNSLVTLSGAADNPTTITTEGLLSAGLYGETLGAAWTITNAGSVLGMGVTLASAGMIMNAGSIAGSATSSSGRGILLGAGGDVSNQSGGTISGYDAVYGEAAMTVVNAGDISGGTSVNVVDLRLVHGNGIVLAAGGSVTNQSGGTISGGDAIYATAATTVVNDGYVAGSTISNGGEAILLDAGGQIINQSSGAISGYGGIEVQNGAGLVVNAGKIVAISSYGVGASGIELSDGGSVTNQSGGTIIGAVVGVGNTSTVVNDGLIQASDLGGVVILSGGAVTNQAGATITGRTGIAGGSTELTVMNAGSISGAAAILGYGIALVGGSVVNQTGGVISGYRGVYARSAAATVLNAGSIRGNRIGIELAAGGTITNQAGGTITAANFYGIDLLAGGLVSNHSGGTISGFDGVRAGTIAATVVNAGTIGGSLGNGVGVYLPAAGLVINEAGGTISGFDGIEANTIAPQVTIIPDALLTTGADAIAGTVVVTTVVNGGDIDGASTNGFGVYLRAGGSVTNQSGGTIGGSAGVRLSTLGGAVVNQRDGTIGSSGAKWGILQTYSGIAFFDSVTVTNAGKISGSVYGIGLSRGSGAVTNQSGGTISGQDGIYGAATVTNAGSIGGSAFGVFRGHSVINESGGVINGLSGVYITGSAGSVVNGGTISSDGTNSSWGVGLLSGGSVTNSASALISGGVSSAAGIGIDAGIYMSGTGAVLNYGSIWGGGDLAAGVIQFNGFLTNASSATISGQDRGISMGAGTISNAGTIDGKFGDGVFLLSGGSVINAASAVISGGSLGHGALGFGIYVPRRAVGTVFNAGSIYGAGTNEAGIALYGGGLVTNTVSGTITGERYGVEFDALGTVVNAGNILGKTRSGIALRGGGLVTNAAAGVISSGVFFSGAAGSVINSGSIAAGIYLFHGGSVTNTVLGSMSGNRYGSSVQITDGGTVVNAGRITGTAGTGIDIYGSGTVTNQSGGTISNATGITFRANYSNLLVIDPGSTIVGTVDGGNTIGAIQISTLELASGASAGTLAGLGTQFINFGSIALDTGADWFVVGNTSGLAGTISGFARGDTIEVTGITVTGSSYAAGVLTLTEASGSATLDLTGSFTTSDFVVTNVAGGTEVGLVCFCAGTLIRTPRGDIEVEALAAGDTVLTLRGEARPIVWVGTGRVLATRGRRSAATPVIIRKSALADNVPYRDLRVTKAHSLFLDGVLIPVEFLINHRSIIWDDRAQEVTVYHIELATHDVLIADGVPAESYRDDGNRWLFQNANSGWNLPPQEPCVPVLTGGQLVDDVWRRLLDRVGPRPSLPITDDADLHMLMDGRRLDAAEHVGEAYIFRLPTVPGSLRIVSRSAVPAELGLARDPRQLGVALRRITVRKGTRFRTIEAYDVGLSESVHAYEPDNGFCWTDGDAVVPAVLFEGFTGPLEFVLQIAMMGRYLDEGQLQGVA